MTPLPVCTALQLAKILERLGFECTRSRGSHFIYRHPDGRHTSLPYHAGKTLPRPLLADILKQVRLEAEEYVGML